MRVLEILNALIAQLPINQTENSDFRENIKRQQELFVNTFSEVDSQDLLMFLPKSDNKLTKKILLNRFEKITKKINEIIESYYNGYLDEAYKGLNQLLNHVSFITNLSDAYGNFLIIRDPKKLVNANYFRMRTIKQEEIEVPTAKELFHAPFENRGKVSTNRYSVPGFPCLYVGRSLQVCYEELNNPKERVYANRLEMLNTIFPLNLSIPEEFTESIYDKENDLNHEAFSFLLTFPLIQSTLFKVKNSSKNDNFKPEYIIPQLLLQYVRKEVPSLSILYTSTKVSENNSDELFQNLVIPVEKIAKIGHCPELKAKIKVSEPIQMLEFSNNALLKSENLLKDYPTEII